MATYGYTFQSGDGVTPTRLNDARTVSAIQTADISDAQITAAKLASNAVETAKILDANVTTAKIADSAVTTAKINDSAVTTVKLAQPFTLRAAQASTSGTSINFTDIPSWAKRITVMFDEVSTNGVSNIAIQLGTSGGFVESGYLGAGSNLAASATFANSSTGFRVSAVNAAASVWHGNATLANLSGNVWTISGALGRSDAEAIGLFAGSTNVGGVVDRLRVTTLAGTDTFDAGSISISYEG